MTLLGAEAHYAVPRQSAQVAANARLRPSESLMRELPTKSVTPQKELSELESSLGVTEVA
jgi:hypothetical protein